MTEFRSELSSKTEFGDTRGLVEIKTNSQRKIAKDLLREAIERVKTHPAAVTTNIDTGCEVTKINTPEGTVVLFESKYKTGEEGISLSLLFGTEKDGQGEWEKLQRIEWVLKPRSLLWNLREKISILGTDNSYLRPRDDGDIQSREKALNNFTDSERLIKLQKEILSHIS